MNEKVRFGIVSFAHYHANYWAQALNVSPKAEFIGIWDDDLRRGEQAAQEYATCFFPNLGDLLEVCDVVGITSETSRHPELVEAAAEANVNILLEKPMAIDMAGCARIYKAVNNSGVLFMQNFPKRYDPINHELVDLVNNNKLGRIVLVRIRHANYHLLKLGEKAKEMWFGNPELAGGGALIDEGIHAADFLLWLLGQPEQVCATISNHALGLPAEDTAIAVFTYPSGCIAEICTSNTLLAADESVEIYGTQGSAILSGIDLASKDFSKCPYLKVYQQGGTRGEWISSPTKPQFQKGNFHHQGVNHIIECLRSGKEPLVSLDDGWKSLKMIVSAYQAAATRKVQQIEFPDTPA